MPTDVITQNTAAQNATADNLYAGVEDTHIKELNPGTNYEVGDPLEVVKWDVGDHTHALIRFTGLSNIPSNATVSSATLYMRFASTFGPDTNQTWTFKRLLRAWIVEQATWNNYATGSAWATAGGLADGTDRDGTASGSFNITDASDWVSVDVTADVQDFIDGTSTNNGHHIERTDGQNDQSSINVTSSNGTDGSRPELVVTYTTGGPTFSMMWRRRRG